MSPFAKDWEFVPRTTCLIEGWAVALAGTVVTAGVGAYEANQANDLAQQGLALAEGTAGKQNYYNSLLQQLISNPSSVSTLPGYQFQLAQGGQTVANQMAASGFSGSGNEAEALEQYGQGLAGSFYSTQANLLASLAGVQNASSPAQNLQAATGAQASASGQISSLLNSLGFESSLALNGLSSAGTPALTQQSVSAGYIQPGSSV